MDAVVEGIGIIGNSKLIIDDTPGISISELRSKCRKMKLEYLSLIHIYTVRGGWYRAPGP